MPNKENIKKWTTRLRETDQVQGFGQLGTPDGKRCCLGVACDVAVEEGIINPPVTHMNEVLYYAGESAFLPRAVADWLGLPPLPILPFDSRNSVRNSLVDGGESLSFSLVDLNDGEYLSFSQIADLIDYEYLSDDSEDME